MDPRNFKKIQKSIIVLLGNILLLPVALVLFVIRVIFRVKFVRLMSSRIGHLCENTDVLLRRKRLFVPKDKLIYIGVAGTKPCNKQLLKMFKREMIIIQIPELIHKSLFFRSWSDNPLSVLHYSDLFKRLTSFPNEFYEFNNTHPTLKFTKEEGEKGKRVLDKMGVNSWFVCFHARDPSYMYKTFNVRGTNHYDYTDCSVDNYLKAAEYLTAKGGFALRMGAVVEKKLPGLKNEKIIDYATKYREDFSDIYLLANCRFFLGNCSGMYLVPTIFNVPVAKANFICWLPSPLRECDLFIPKKVWSAEKNRFLTFKEILKADLSGCYTKEDYARSGLKLVENTPEEILELAIEMNERIDKTWETTEEDERLQRKFYSVFKHMNDLNGERAAYNCPARIGAVFLRKNRGLLE